MSDKIVRLTSNGARVDGVLKVIRDLIQAKENKAPDVAWWHAKDIVAHTPDDVIAVDTEAEANEIERKLEDAGASVIVRDWLDPDPDGFECAICGGWFSGFGNNPSPRIRDIDARCCNDCNQDVIEDRVMQFIAWERENQNH
jgi:hypothetical protein